MANTNTCSNTLTAAKYKCVDIFNYISMEQEKRFNEGMKRLDCIREKAIKEENKKELLRRMANRKPY